MIDEHVISQLSGTAQIEVKRALATLAITKVLEQQRRLCFERVSEGADNEDVDSLASRILNYRREAQALAELHQLGERYLEELK